MEHPQHYINYVGQYVKRFYRPFDKEAIHKIKDFRMTDKPYGPEFLYDNGIDEPWWTDCEDSCIITNELPDLNLDWVANVNSKEYQGYNPFTNKEI